MPRGATDDGVSSTFRSVSLWWALVATTTLSGNVLPDLNDDAEIGRKCGLYAYHTTRRAKMEAADMSAAAVAKNDLASNYLLTAIRAWISDKLYSTVGYVGDLVGAAMAYAPNWARVARVDFGDAMRRAHFFLEDDVTMLNSCAVPCLSKPVALARKEWAARIQLDTVQWRFKAKSLKLSQVVEKICQKVRARPTDASLCTSFADATGTLLRSVSWMPTDRILIVHHTEFEGSVYPQARQLTALHGVDVVVVHLDFLDSPKVVAERIRRTLRKVMPRLTIVPHILDDGLIVPVSQVVSDCAGAGCISVVDGSMAVGNTNVDISSINADVYVARLDGYCFCYPGLTLTVTNAARFNCLETLTVSYFHGRGFSEEWRYYGHSDHSLWLCATQAFQFQKFICFDYQDYCTRLARKALRYLCEAWQVQPLRPGQEDEWNAIVCVPLPPGLGTSPDDIRLLSQALENWKIYVGIVHFVINQDVILACRLTCNVFNTAADIQRLAAAVSALAARRAAVGQV